MAQVPEWRLEGDWFDVCSCNVACPCEFAQPPTNNRCEGALCYHIREGRYGDVTLDDLNVIACIDFTGNVWAGETTMATGVLIDDRADGRQQEALQMIFGGQAGGWPAAFAALIDLRGVEVAPIKIEVDDDLGAWRAEVPGKVKAVVEALTGPTAQGLVQMTNPPGSEVGPLAPGAVCTWGKSSEHQVHAFGMDQEFSGRSSKHLPFAWSGPDAA